MIGCRIIAMARQDGKNVTDTARTLTQSTSQELIDNLTVRCLNDSGFHRSTRLFRAFDLAELDIFHDIAVGSVEVGIERAIAGPGGQQTAEIRLDRVDEALILETSSPSGPRGL